jgi:hypothetical protein
MRLFRYPLIGLGLVIAIPVALFLKLCLDIDRQGRMDRAQPADTIVVLGARLLPDGRPSDDLKERTWHGVELYRAGWAHNVICTGGARLAIPQEQRWPRDWLSRGACLRSRSSWLRTA